MAPRRSLLIVDPLDQRERRGLLVRFGLRAAVEGYRQVLGPVTLPVVGYRDTRGERPLSGIVFFFETPPAAPDPDANA